MATSFSASQSHGGGARISLFGNQIIRFVMLLGGCAFSVYLGLQIANPDANGLATTVQWIAVAAFFTAVVSPKTGIYLVLIMCPFLDLIKRMLILFSDANMTDVTIVLAIAPATMGGAVIGTFGSRLLLKKTLFDPGEKPLFLLMMATSSLIVVGAVLHEFDSKLALLRDLGETCVYLTLIYLVPVHFSTSKEIARVFRCVVLLFTPVALYGFWQAAFGLSDFENLYLLSGLTIGAEDYLASGRIFSTLNSNHSFSVTMACCAIIAWLLRYLPAQRSGSAWLKSFSWVFSLLFTAACLVSLRRTGWLVIGMSVAGAFCFRSPRRTKVFYGICLTGLLLIIFNSEALYTSLPFWEAGLQRAMPGFDQAFQLQTFNDRLYSFQTLTEDPNIWTLFGVPSAERTDFHVHDAISETLISYGVVGSLAFVVVLVVVLVISHRVVWRSDDRAERGYAALLLSMIFANIFIGAVMQSHISIFPINFLFWLCVGALTTVTFKKPAAAAAGFDLETLQAIIESSTKGKAMPAIG
jgi:hypothetical protein